MASTITLSPYMLQLNRTGRNPSTGKEIRIGRTDSGKTGLVDKDGKPTKYRNWRITKPWG